MKASTSRTIRVLLALLVLTAIAGSAQEVIGFLARPKLGLPRELLYDSRRLSGQVAVDLHRREALLYREVIAAVSKRWAVYASPIVSSYRL